MLTGLSIEEMYVYYAITKVHAAASSRSIKLFTDIALKAADRYSELYQAHPLPFFHPGIKKFMAITKPFSYLAVAADQQFFMILTSEMLTKCTKDYLYRMPLRVCSKKDKKPRLSNRFVQWQNCNCLRKMQTNYFTR
jgi:hypothetical protein